jgi:hypothetical protein
VAESSQEQHRIGLAVIRAKVIARSVNAGAHPLTNMFSVCRQIRRQVIAIFASAYLYPIAIPQAAQFKTERPQIFVKSFEARQRALGVSKPARDGLKINIVLERCACQPLETCGVVEQRGVLQLQHIDALQKHLAMDQPFQIGTGELTHCVRRNGRAGSWSGVLQQKLGGRAEIA